MTASVANIDLQTQLKQKRICRFCMTIQEPLTNIYSNENRIKTRVPLPLQIMSCVSIEVFTNDGMPSLICDPCRLVMDYTYRFKQMCKKSDTALKQYPLTGKWLEQFVLPQYPEELMKLQISPTILRIPIKRPANTSIKQPPAKRQDTTAEQSPPTVQAIKLSPLPAVTQPQSPVKVQVPRQKTSVQQSKPFPTGIVQASQSKILNTQAQVKILNKEAPSNKFQIRQVITDESGDTFELTEVLKEQPDLLDAEHVATNVYPCTKCERSFPLRQLLTIHMANHTRERCFECDICSKRFFSKYDLGKHTLIHTGDKPFVCVICNKAFSRSTLLSRHERIHTDQPKFLCAHCDRPFLSKIELDKHSIRHNKKRPFPCNICNKTFAFKQGLERHEVIHSKVQPYKCEHCEVSFSTPSKLARHLTAHAGRRPYPCRLCPKSYLLSHHLTRHVRSHKDATGTFKCFNCSKVFKSRSELVYHSAIHATQDLVCPLCKEGFGSLNDVTDHIKSHTEGEQFACEFCDLIFTTDERLCNHTANEHADEYETYAHDERTRVIKREVGAVVDTPQLNDGEEVIEEYIIDTISDKVSPPPRILNYAVKPATSVTDQNNDEEEVEEDESIPFDEVEVDEDDAEIEYEEEYEDDASHHEDEGMEFEVEEHSNVKQEKVETPASQPLLKASPKMKNEKLALPPIKQIPIAQQKLEQSLQAALRASAPRSTPAPEPIKSVAVVKTLPVKSPPVKSPPAKSPPAKSPPAKSPLVKEASVKKEPSPILRKVNMKSLPAGISVKRKVPNPAPAPLVLPPKPSPPPKAVVREQDEPKQQTIAPVTRAKTVTPASKKPPAATSTNKKSPANCHEKSSSSDGKKSSPSGSNGKNSAHHPNKPPATNTKSPASNNDKPTSSGSSRPSTRNASKDVVSMMIGHEMVQVQKVKMTKAQVEVMEREGKIEFKDGQVFLKQKKIDKK